jgi:imidazolonepropionase-like amidohydrolase
MLALRGGKIITMRKGTFDQGTLLIKDGKIVAVGSGMEVPSEYQILDLSGKVVTPGLIDAHTHLGVFNEGMGWAGEDGNERVEAITPGMHALDAINPFDVGLADAFQAGITTAMVAPGSANPIGGQCVIIKTGPNHTADQMLLKKHAGLKIAFGENPKRCHGTDQKKMPVTRMAVAAMIREALWKARHYISTQGEKGFQYDGAMEAIARVLKKEMPLRAHAHRADDIMTALRIAREFDVDIIIEHATEAHLIVEELARQKVPVVLGPLLSTRSKVELKEKSMASPEILYRQGILFAIATDHPVIPSYLLPISAGLATRYGLPAIEALKAITSNAAKLLHIDDRVGSLAEGMDADMVVWSGDPLTIATRPEFVIVDGQIRGKGDALIKKQ